MFTVHCPILSMRHRKHVQKKMFKSVKSLSAAYMTDLQVLAIAVCGLWNVRHCSLTLWRIETDFGKHSSAYCTKSCAWNILSPDFRNIDDFCTFQQAILKVF